MRETDINLQKIGVLNDINVLFGRRGSGKTTFLIQLAFNSTYSKNVFLILSNKKRDYKILRRLKKKIKYKPENIEIKRITDLSDLISLLGKISIEKITDSLIILDDVFPVQFYVGKEWTKKLAAELGMIIALIIDIINQKNTVWISIPEHSNRTLPRRWQMFIDLTDNFYRLLKKRRIRELYRIKISGIPDIGEYWSSALENIQVEPHLIQKFLLTSAGFVSLERE